MIIRFTLLAVAIVAGRGWTQAQTMVASPQFTGGPVTQIPVLVTDPHALDPYATVATQSPYQATVPWFGDGAPYVTGPMMENFSNPRDRFWVRLEYLNWWTEGTNVPALVTTSPDGTPQDTAAVLGESGTSVLFGNQELNGGSVAGFQTAFGFWGTPQHTWGLEVEYFKLAQQDDGYGTSGNGSPILGRPFFDIVAGRQTAQLISFPDLVSGNISIASNSDLRSFLLNGRMALIPTNGACYSPCDPQDRTDWILGFRRLKLDDNLSFNENLESVTPTAPGSLVLNESFATQNDFSGLQLGVINVTHMRRAWVESMLRVALGNSTQRVAINGSTAITESGITDTFTGGLLAQRTNIGTYERDQFIMIPELGVKLGVRLTDRAFVTLGYSVLYFPNVVRSGEQIDTDVNPGLVPPETVPLVGTLRPTFRYIESDYIANGISLGGELRF